MDMKKMRKKSKKGGKMLPGISGGKSSSRLDKRARGGMVQRPDAEGMSPDSPMSNATKGGKKK